MNKLQQARIALNNKFPFHLKYFWYKGLRINSDMFYYG